MPTSDARRTWRGPGAVHVGALLAADRGAPPGRRHRLPGPAPARRRDRHGRRPRQGAVHPRVPAHPGRVHRRRAGPVASPCAATQGAVSYPDSVGIGMYRIDLHPSTGGDNYIDVASLPVRDPARRADARAGSRTCCRPARTSAPPTSPTAATGCTRSSGTSARPPARSPRSAWTQRPQPPHARAVRDDPARLADFQSRLTADGVELALARRRRLLSRTHRPTSQENPACETIRASSRYRGAARPAAVRLGDDGPADTGPVSLRMTIWTANEAHLKLFNGIAGEYKTAHPDVTEIKFDSLPFDTYTTALTTQIAGGNAARPRLDPRDLRARLRLLRRAGAARRHAEDDAGLQRSAISARAPTKLWTERRQALRLPVLDLAVRRVRQQRPDQEGRRSRPPRS